MVMRPALGVKITEITYHVYQSGDTDSPEPERVVVGFIIRLANELIEFAVSSSLTLYTRGRWGLETYSQWARLN